MIGLVLLFVYWFLLSFSFWRLFGSVWKLEVADCWGKDKKKKQKKSEDFKIVYGGEIILGKNKIEKKARGKKNNIKRWIPILLPNWEETGILCWKTLSSPFLSLSLSFSPSLTYSDHLRAGGNVFADENPPLPPFNFVPRATHMEIEVTCTPWRLS